MTLSDGTKLSEHTTAVRGTPANPMTRDEVAAKSKDLLKPVPGPSATPKLIDRVLNLEQVKNVVELGQLLKRA